MIKAYNLNKYYNKGKQNEIHVINDCTLSLPDKGLVTFFGASGSGKTTLLNVLGGLDKAQGMIDYNGVVFKKYQISKIDKLRREKIGYIFQNYNLLLDYTVYDNLKIALSAVDITDKDEVTKRCDYALKKVGLYKYRKKLASQLSGGQMQRVSIARALVKNASVIIADEPTGNLDSNNSIEIMNILKKISENALVLLVTHDKDLAEYFSDKIVEIQDGKIKDIRDTNKDKTNLKANDNHIYLQDLVKVDNDSLTYYFENDTLKKLELTIIEHNNVFYLKSNSKIKLLDESPLQVIDDKYENVKENEDFEYDTSFYNNKKQNNSFKNFFKTLKNEFVNFFKVSKKTKFFYIAMLLIGLIVGFINISYSSYMNVDANDLSYDNDVYQLSQNDSSKDVYQILNKAKDTGLIDSYYNVYENYYTINYYKNSYQSTSIFIYSYMFDTDLIKSYNIIAGRKALYENEIIVGKKLAEYIMSKIGSEATYDSLLSCSFGYSELTIVGVCDKDSYCFYQIGKKLTLGDNLNSNTYFTTPNYDGLTSYLSTNDMKMDTIYNVKYDILKADYKESKFILVPVIIVLVSITLIYIYFSMRSKMINDIYTIGVFRAIGIKRSKITLRYGIEIFVITLFTTLLGYLSVCIIYGSIIERFKRIGGSGVDIFNSPSTYIIGLLLFIVSIVIGLLPITTLMRKTPSQILSKYDI